jgi:hypothetical protein
MLLTAIFSHDRLAQHTSIVYNGNEVKECKKNKFLISEKVNSVHFEPGLR